MPEIAGLQSLTATPAGRKARRSQTLPLAAFRPLRWYLGELEWSAEGTTTVVELALDLEAMTVDPVWNYVRAVEAIAPAQRDTVGVHTAGMTLQTVELREEAARRVRLEDAGQQEMLNWMCLAGAMQELDRKPEIVEFLQTYVFNSSKCLAVMKP